MKGKESHDLLAKLIIIGDTGVGKTNIILTFVGECFRDNYVATIGVDFKAKTLDVQGKKIKLQIWDTAGQERYRTITQTYYKGASAIILAYALDNRQSFESLTKWIMQIGEKAPPNVPKIIIANKKDLQATRQISYSEGMSLANKYSTEKCRILFEQVSAKTGQGIQESFYAITKKVKEEFQKQHVTTPVLKIAKSKQPDPQPSKCMC